MQKAKMQNALLKDKSSSNHDGMASDSGPENRESKGTRKIYKLQAGDMIPEGAKFLGREEGLGPAYECIERRPAGLYGGRVRCKVEKRDPVTFWIYEAEVSF